MLSRVRPMKDSSATKNPMLDTALLPCNNCPLCVPPYDVARRQQPAVRFGPSQRHRFVNGYQTILNCPADCHTRNIVYVMTCPCGEYEYIGETSQRIGDRLKCKLKLESLEDLFVMSADHRQHGNRIIPRILDWHTKRGYDPNAREGLRVSEHRFFGERCLVYSHRSRTLVKDRMLVYKHAARCPWTIQIFLNFNPVYECFIPMTITEAGQKNRKYVPPSSLVFHDVVNPTSIASKDREAIVGSATTRSDEMVRSCMRNIPLVPPGYTFSTRQRIQQFQYFKAKHDIKIGQDPTIDLFNVAIIAVCE